MRAFRLTGLWTAPHLRETTKINWLTRNWTKLALAAVILLAGLLRFTNLSSLGYVNTYYTATVTSMLASWHNFFFVAAEPGGAVSVDKPPLGFWLQAASAFVFGVNTFGILLPQLLAGMLSVALLYHLVGRRFGPAAGLVAAFALATTPVVVATDRNNTIDSTLLFVLLLAAWAFIRATESGRIKYLLLGAVAVGLGFNIKMLQAFLPLPAFYAAYFLGAPGRWFRKVGKLAAASLVLACVSFSWITIVDLTPATQRPYVGSSGNNSAWSLALGYNGMQRLLGMGQSNASVGAVVERLTSSLQPRPETAFGASARTGRPMTPPGWPSGGGASPAGGAVPGGAPPANGMGPGGTPFAFGGGPGAAPFMDGGGPDGGGRGGGGPFNTGQPGFLRLITGPLRNEVSWLLPFGLFASVLLGFRARPSWPLAPKHQALVIWGGWLVTAAVFFSVAGFFHSYYLVMLAPPLAALVGIGVAELWALRSWRWWFAVALTTFSVAGTGWLQYQMALYYVKPIWWLPAGLALLAIGILVLLISRQHWPRLARAGFGCMVAAMLLTPAIWSGLTTRYSVDSLPAAYSGQSGANRGFGFGPGGAQVDEALLAYLEANTQGMKYLMAVPSSGQGASYVIATSRGVLYLGGFSGQDAVETADSLAFLVANGDLRYVYQGGGGGGPGGRSQSSINSWLSQSCQQVEVTATTQNPVPGNSRQRGGLGTLYDCQSASGKSALKFSADS
jgi:4-amino-4-deoxy-L-arabinose transferase-like glycosyltransferase